MTPVYVFSPERIVWAPFSVTTTKSPSPEITPENVVFTPVRSPPQLPAARVIFPSNVETLSETMRTPPLKSSWFPASTAMFVTRIVPEVSWIPPVKELEAFVNIRRAVLLYEAPELYSTTRRMGPLICPLSVKFAGEPVTFRTCGAVDVYAFESVPFAVRTYGSASFVISIANMGVMPSARNRKNKIEVWVLRIIFSRLMIFNRW